MENTRHSSQPKFCTGSKSQNLPCRRTAGYRSVQERHCNRVGSAATGHPKALRPIM
ncbi:hypothetical protein M3J09_011534 [Ascochyta lentis]